MHGIYQHDIYFKQLFCYLSSLARVARYSQKCVEDDAYWHARNHVVFK
jgi:hypothetical protein